MPQKFIKITIISTIVIGLILLFIVISKKGTEPNQTSQTDGQGIIKFNGVQPGKSSQKDVKDKLNEPKKDYTQGSYNVWEYASDNPNFNNLFYFENERLVFVKQIVIKQDAISAGDLKEKYKTTEYILYGPLSNVGQNLYVYPESGIAYLAHGKSGIVFEIWYFTPTTLNDFRLKWAKEYNPIGPIEKPDRIY